MGGRRIESNKSVSNEVFYNSQKYQEKLIIVIFRFFE